MQQQSRHIQKTEIYTILVHNCFLSKSDGKKVTQIIVK